MIMFVQCDLVNLGSLAYVWRRIHPKIILNSNEPLISPIWHSKVSKLQRFLTIIPAEWWLTFIFKVQKTSKTTFSKNTSPDSPPNKQITHSVATYLLKFKWPSKIRHQTSGVNYWQGLTIRKRLWSIWVGPVVLYVKHECGGKVEWSRYILPRTMVGTATCPEEVQVTRIYWRHVPEFSPLDPKTLTKNIYLVLVSIIYCSVRTYQWYICWHIPNLIMDILYQWEVHLTQSIATTLQPWGSQSLSRLGVGAHQVPTLGPATPSKQKWWRLRKAGQVYYPSHWIENPWCKQSFIGSTWFNHVLFNHILFLQTTQHIQRYQASPYTERS